MAGAVVGSFLSDETLVMTGAIVNSAYYSYDGDLLMHVTDSTIGGVTYTGDGSQRITIDHSTIGGIEGNYVNNSAVNDDMSVDIINGSSVGALALATYNQGVTVNATGSTVTSAATGADADTVSLVSTRIGAINTNAGADYVEVADSTLTGVMSLGLGDDTLRITGNSSVTAASLNGGGGTDRLELDYGSSIRIASSTVAYVLGVDPIGTIQAVLSTSSDWYATLTNGATLRALAFEEIGAVCFTAGTLIETEAGPMRAIDLAKGDRVQTLDHGLQPVRWIG